MNLRTATADDAAAIRSVAERSFEASYALSPQEIETLVEHVFAEEAVTDRLDDGDGDVVAVEASDADGDDEVVGFAEFEADATLRWLHVDPAVRGRGFGADLFERVRAATAERDDPLTARILTDANQGDTFLETYGLEPSGTTEFEAGGEGFAERVYRASGDANDPNEPSVDVPASVTVDGADRPLDRDEPVPGTDSPFFETHERASLDERYGFFCSNCGSTSVSADGLDRLECGECGNVHRAEQWDGAYL